MKLKYNCHFRAGRRRHGQGLVESALVLMFILLPLSMGILQFGIYLNAANTVQQLAREGGRYAAVGNSDAAIRTYIRTVATGTSIKPADLTDANITITMVPATATRAAGNPIRVSVAYPMAKKVFLSGFGIAKMFGTTKIDDNYVAQSTFVLE